MSTEIRACRPKEKEAVVTLVNRVFRPAGGAMDAQYPLVFAPDNLDGLRIAFEAGAPVAHVGVCVREAVLMGARFRVAGIGAVCTDPPQRGQGLASALMADAVAHARRSGASLMLISGGRGLYHRLGYVTVGRFDRYDLGPEQLPKTTPEVTVAAHHDADLPALAALHQAEPVRFVRSLGDWRGLLNAGMLINRPGELLVVRQSGYSIAYLAVQIPRDVPDEGRGPAHIREYAGSRTAMTAALPAVLDRYQTTRVSFVAQPTDPEMTFLARRHGWTALPEPFPGTLGVIDPPAFMAGLRPVLAERAAAADRLSLSASTAGVNFSLDDQHYAVAAPGPLAALLFGGDTEEARALPACPGALGDLLRALFPLPLLWQGYNYV